MGRDGSELDFAEALVAMDKVGMALSLIVTNQTPLVYKLPYCFPGVEREEGDAQSRGGGENGERVEREGLHQVIA